MAFNDFETLLTNHSTAIDNLNARRSQQKENPSKMLTASKSATLFDFIKMVDKLITLTMKDDKVKFIPDEGKPVELKSEKGFDHPIIAYKLIERKPKDELKPRYREGFVEEDSHGDGRVGEIYGQKFQCHVQFDIYASKYDEVESIMEHFEDMMITYAGYFKKNGVAELLFDKQLTDSSYEIARQTLSVRNVRYYVEIEKLTVIMNESIKTIDSFGDLDDR